MKVAIINHGMGNLSSVRRAFEDVGAEVYIADHPESMDDADGIVLPGVGSFAEGMGGLRAGGWILALQDNVLHKRTPLLGICLGMQMLATRSYEGGLSDGLNFVPGEVHKLDRLGCNLRIPHVGWNEVMYNKNDVQNDLLFNEIPECSDFYFVHSYAVVPENADHLIATVPYGCDVAAAIRHGNVFGCQFHPEKSSKAGRQLLKNFMEYMRCSR